ncbi:hypothetical protein MTAT_29250 [Moorella thermoacetica]|uniref:Uncharacterized protein n=1 Tax=Neomoorella thermoacetica TaxID=1525 RepID=A0AAC9MT27_NEOTH|nr:hypothetical protein Maut_00539 [Moorella thermoacetica]TYL07249.1 hypothetical protein MTAT_29250 [Moorella thermoacetica]
MGLKPFHGFECQVGFCLLLQFFLYHAVRKNPQGNLLHYKCEAEIVIYGNKP